MLDFVREFEYSTLNIFIYLNLVALLSHYNFVAVAWNFLFSFLYMLCHLCNSGCLWIRVQTPGYPKTRWVFWVHPPKKPTLLL